QAWEACITLGTAWQFQPTNETYKTGGHVIRLLTDTRAKGGSLLLNVGPDALGKLCPEQEGVLRELALWHFINGECLHDTRPWVLTNEEDTYLLKAKDGSAVYAVLLGEKNWKRGERREVILRSVAITESSRISVLGISGELTEYRPDIDARPYMKQQEDGLHLSLMNAQRIYCGTDWPGPLVVKITDPRPAFLPLAVETLTEDEDITLGNGGAVLRARVLSMGSFDRAELSFHIRVYPGFALSSYEEGWETISGEEVTETGVYSTSVSNLKGGVTYQFRAVLSNEKTSVKGELALFVAEE
ncbi:MAG: alpha-L-fucosidase, partial [Lachnospiraceae bacterium]|nr:alpha-L-fucosidase [Lachnospiraceae bacterium]